MWHHNLSQATQHLQWMLNHLKPEPVHSWQWTTHLNNSLHTTCTFGIHPTPPKANQLPSTGASCLWKLLLHSLCSIGNTTHLLRLSSAHTLGNCLYTSSNHTCASITIGNDPTSPAITPHRIVKWFGYSKMSMFAPYKPSLLHSKPTVHPLPASKSSWDCLSTLSSTISTLTMSRKNHTGHAQRR